MGAYETCSNNKFVDFRREFREGKGVCALRSIPNCVDAVAYPRESDFQFRSIAYFILAKKNHILRSISGHYSNCMASPLATKGGTA